MINLSRAMVLINTPNDNLELPTPIETAIVLSCAAKFYYQPYELDKHPIQEVTYHYSNVVPNDRDLLFKENVYTGTL